MTNLQSLVIQFLLFIMQKIAKGTLESRIDDVRSQLLEAVAGAPEDVLRREETIGAYSVAEIFAYLGEWGEVVNKGLREIQRRKKPMDLLRAMEQHDAFQKRAVEACRHDEWEDILIRLEDTQIQVEERLAQYSHDDLNRPKRIRFLGNKPLWPFVAQVTYENEARFVPEIAAFVKRAMSEQA